MELDAFESIRAGRQSNGNGRPEQSLGQDLGQNLGEVIRSVGLINAREDLPPVDGRSPPRDWDALIAHLRTAARASGEAEMRLRHREAHAQLLLRCAHRRLDEAAERLGEAEQREREAEARVHAAEARAEALIEAAELRASRAEAAARSALAWLQHLRQAGMGAFAGRPVAAAGPALRRVA